MSNIGTKSYPKNESFVLLDNIGQTYIIMGNYGILKLETFSDCQKFKDNGNFLVNHETIVEKGIKLE
jgi:hypothetical protein